MSSGWLFTFFTDEEMGAWGLLGLKTNDLNQEGYLSRVMQIGVEDTLG